MHFTALQDVEKVPHLESPGKRSIMQKLLHLVAALGNIMLLSEWKSVPLPPGILQKLLGQEGLGFSHSGASSHGWSSLPCPCRCWQCSSGPAPASTGSLALLCRISNTQFTFPRSQKLSDHQSHPPKQTHEYLWIPNKGTPALPKDQPLLFKNRSISSELETWLHHLATYSSLLVPLHPHL